MTGHHTLLTRAALIFGVLFLVSGVAGFIPALVTAPGPDAHPVEHGRLLGLFPTNAIHNVLHLIFGAWGLAAMTAVGRAKIYMTAVLISYAALTIFGLVGGLNTLFGTAPIYGHDVWLHAVIAVAAAAVLLYARRKPAARPQAAH